MLSHDLAEAVLADAVERITPEAKSTHDDQGRSHPGHCEGESSSLPARLLSGLVRRLFRPQRGLFLLPFVATFLNHVRQHVVGQLDTLNVQPLFEVKQPALDQVIDRGRLSTALSQDFLGTLERHVLAQARIRHQLVFDKRSDRRRLVGNAPLVIILQDPLAAARQEIGRDLRQSQRQTPIVQLAADQAQERRLQFQPARPSSSW